MSKEDELLTSKCSNRDVCGSKPRAKQDCLRAINISVFFDGTGNKKAVDEPKLAWSIPARLWQAVCVSGVGAPFAGPATDWIGQKSIELEKNVPGFLCYAGEPVGLIVANKNSAIGFVRC
jgi:hypothetical protein